MHEDLMAHFVGQSHLNSFVPHIPKITNDEIQQFFDKTKACGAM
jgi:hypothetical protein